MDIKRVLIKISGEALAGNSGILDFGKIQAICEDIKDVIGRGVGVSIVVGGGNIIRGRVAYSEIDREDVDSMGMLATSINGIALRSCFEKLGVDTVLMSNLSLPFGIESSDFHNIRNKISDHKTIIFVGGAGYPYFSTDTISVVNAITTRSDIIWKATKTDGLYDKDPAVYKDAQFIERISHEKALEMGLTLMDHTAFSMAKDHKMPIMFFSVKEPKCFSRVLSGGIKHSVVT